MISDQHIKSERREGKGAQEGPPMMDGVSLLLGSVLVLTSFWRLGS